MKSLSGISLVDWLVYGLTGFGIFFSLIRFMVGPTSFDRLASVDMMNVMIVGLISIFALLTENNMYMDIAIVYALLSFVETIVFSRYLERKCGEEK
ncbi:cation:proton antiporter [Fervidobacterium thailandense]|uniref:pH regulation protein F n=1 Tax=Fervidobacterium thailandense TaxID=1008305 RepID=A0A1E3G342_9BACT|nr:cation:proton antiporter [Fervidobacterium thailandense]ODN30657.1 pH regulation protein F [Fervidobacterium thailandense]